MKSLGTAWLCTIIGLAIILPSGNSASAEALAERVILVTFDGLRLQEMFGGIDKRLVNGEHGGVESPTTLRKRFAGETPEQSRGMLLPFMWGTIARDGVILGDPAGKSSVTVLNEPRISYPGYVEILVGVPDPRMRQNARMPNKKVTVLEWLHNKPEYQGAVAAYCSWDVFNFILNEERAGFPVNAGWEEPLPDDGTAETQTINEVMREMPHFWKTARVDYFTYAGAVRHLRNQKPKVLFVSFDETDDWAHKKRYDMYLDAAQRADAYVQSLWETAQSMDEYRGKTALLITTDHGRGDTTEDWTDHNGNVEGCEFIWIAAMGAGIEQGGIARKGKATQGQIAATVAALLGEDYNAANPEAAPPLPILSR